MPPFGYTQPDSLTGKEFEFDSLIWTPDDNWGHTVFEMQDINLFSNPNRNLSIILKEDSSAFWVPVVRAANFQYQGFVYAVGSGTLFIRPVPVNTSMIGKYFSIRITFS